MLIGLISDIHSNLQAFETVLERLGDCEQIVCLGDIVGYGANPDECVERMRELDVPCVLGNHDAVCIDLLSLGWFNPFAAAAARWTREQLTKPSLEHLRRLPRSAHLESFYMVHGSPREPTTEYLTDKYQARDSFELCDDRVILVGHTHVPLVFMERNGEEAIIPRDGEWISYKRRRLIYNPGSVGQPRDGDPRAAFSLIDTTSRKIGLLRAEYDVESARDAIVDAGLPRILADRLLVGR